MEHENIDHRWGNFLLPEASPFRYFGMRISTCDVLVLQFLDHVRVATRGQIAQQLDCSVPRVDRIMARLNGCGLTFGRSMAGIGLRGEALSISADGSKLLGAGGSPTNAAEIPLLHALPLTDLIQAFENSGEIVVTDLEIRREHRLVRTLQEVRKGVGEQGIARFAIGNETSVHYPDLVLNRSSGAVAIEYERSRKSSNRLMKIMSSYAASETIVGVTFFVPSRASHDALARMLNNLIQAKGCADKVSISRYSAKSLERAPLA